VVLVENKFTRLELIEEPKMMLIILAEFVAERLSFAPSAEAKS
jgi:hypothetical protein